MISPIGSRKVPDMARKTTDYSKPKLINYLRSLADTGKSWRDMQVDILPGVTCIGDLYPLLDGAPDNTPRHARHGTAMSRTEIRHCLRDVCRCVAMLDEVSNKRMDEAWRDRARAQAELDEFAGVNGGWGKYHSMRRDIEKLKSALERVAKVGVLDDEKRRLSMVRDSASNRFASTEDRRFFLDQTRKRYVGSFSEVHDWTPPTERDPTDTRTMLEVAIDEVDFDEIDFDGSKVYFVQHISGRYVGNSQTGPLFFRLKTAAYAYTENKQMFSLSESTLTADAVRETVRWYNENHRFILSEPADGLWLYEQYPQLASTRPVDDGEFQESMEAATSAITEW